MSAILDRRIRRNLDRVRGLVDAHDQLLAVPPGGANPRAEDVLRAAVVLVHASLEDLLRTISAERLPGTTNKEILNQIPFPGADERRTRFSIGDLSDYRGRSVSDLISEAVGSYLNRVSYNTPDDIARCLHQIGLPPALVAPFAPQLDALMRRRHHIVHRVDANEAPRARRATRPIDKPTVEAWVQAVGDFGSALIRAL